MKAVPTDLQTYLAARKAIIDRNMIWITTASAVTFGFHDGDLDETVSVINPATGTSTSRAYKGGGHIVGVPDVVESPSLSVRSISFLLASASSDIAAMIDGFDLRGATIEWHKGFLDEATMAFVATPECEFLGFIDGCAHKEPALDLETGDTGEETFSLDCVSHTRELTRTNARTRSYRHGLERSSDEIFKYTGAVGRWKIRWGLESKAHHQGWLTGGKGTHTVDRRD